MFLLSESKSAMVTIVKKSAQRGVRGLENLLCAPRKEGDSTNSQAWKTKPRNRPRLWRDLGREGTEAGEFGLERPAHAEYRTRVRKGNQKSLSRPSVQKMKLLQRFNKATWISLSFACHRWTTTEWFAPQYFRSNSYSTIPPAVATFSELFWPSMGMRT